MIVGVGRVLCVCVSEEHRDGEGVGCRDLSRLSYTRKYISLAAESARVWGYVFATT